jgi:hypothetical protein
MYEMEGPYTRAGRGSHPAAIGFRRPGIPTRTGVMPSEAGVLSRNGNASISEDEPGRLVCADDLSSEEGRLVPMPRRYRSGRTSSSSTDGG